MGRHGPARRAVSALFLLNGLAIGSWAPKLPVLMARLNISESVAGLLVLVLGLGSITIMPLYGALVAQRGSAPALRLAALMMLPALLLISLAGSVWTVAVAVFLFGGAVGGMDVAMNANAVAVERARGRAIMSSCHGFWSLGGLAGAGAGGVAIMRLGETGHAVAVTLVMAGGLAWALPRLLAEPAEPMPAGATVARARVRLPRTGLPYLVGVMALACMIPEGAIIDWAAVYLQSEMGAPLGLAGWGFGACAGTMAVMRFAGDGLRQRFGAVRVLRAGALVAMAGLAIAGLAGSAGIAILGFALAGIGIANLVPIAFSAAGNMPGVASGVGLSVVTTMGYSGILLAPASIGWLAEHVSFASIYLGLAALFAVPLLMSRIARSADFDAPEPALAAPAPPQR